MSPAAPPALLTVEGLEVSFDAARPRGPRSAVLRGVSFALQRGEAVALVGASGSGKSTLARCILGLLRPDRGRVTFEGADGGAQMVFQDPFASLNPVHTVRHHLTRPMLLRRPGADVAPRLARLLEDVGLAPELLDAHPHALSGGQRQRVAIARALAAEPALLVADEPTSMLDVSIRMEILNLLDRLRREQGLTLLLITHDLASARYVTERALVLYAGQLVEEGPIEELLAAPLHPHTRQLASAARHRPAAPARDARASLTGCSFAPRCAELMPACTQAEPQLVELEGRRVRCLLPTLKATEVSP
jgi:peptide/nickel transport system ATP-binding protein